MANLNFFNPGHGIIETKTSPHARTLRTSFEQKLADAFFVVAGSSNILSSWFRDIIGWGEPVKDHVGLLDIATAGILQIIDYLACLVWKSENPLLKFGLGFILGLIAVLFALARVLIAAFIVFNPLSLLVISTVQWASQAFFGGAELNEKTKNFVLYKAPPTQCNYNHDESCPNTWDIIRDNFTVGYDDLGNLGKKEGEIFGLPRFYKQADNNIVGINIKTRAYEFYAPLFHHHNDDEKEIEKVKAALKLNLGRVTQHMENYLALYEKNPDPTISQNCQDCHKVLNLIAS